MSVEMRFVLLLVVLVACSSVAPGAQAAEEFSGGEVAAACDEPSNTPYPVAVRGDSPVAYWRLCQWAKSTPSYTDETGGGATLQASPNATSGTTAPDTSSKGSPLANETNAYQKFERSYINAPSVSGAYAPLSQMAARGPFTIEAWVRPKSSYTTCSTCGFVVPVARSANSWQLGWAGTAPARGRDWIWVHQGIPGPPVGANGWTFTIYDGFDNHCTPTCRDDPNHYVTAHRLQTTAPIEAGRWYYVAATYDGLTMRLYVDGRLAGELGIGSIGNVLGPNQGLFGFGYASDEEGASNTGVMSGTPRVQLEGSVDEGAFYGRALGGDEIAEHYDASQRDPQSPAAGVDTAYRRGVEHDNPFLWFPLDEHYVETSATSKTCNPCPSYERTTAQTAGNIGAPVRDISGPVFPVGQRNRGLEFSGHARMSVMTGPRHPIPVTPDASIETWIKTADSTPEKQAFFFAPTCTGCTGRIGLRLNGGVLELRADSDGYPTNTWQPLGGESLNDRKWLHVLVVRDLTGSATWRAYIDGNSTEVTRPTSDASLLEGGTLAFGEVNTAVGITGGGRVALDEFAYSHAPSPQAALTISSSSRGMRPCSVTTMTRTLESYRPAR